MWPWLPVYCTSCTTICCRSGCHCLFWAAVIILQPRQAWASFHASLYTILPADWAFRLLWVNIILLVLDWNKESNSWTDPVIAVPVTMGMIPFIVQRCDNQCVRLHSKHRAWQILRPPLMLSSSFRTGKYYWLSRPRQDSLLRGRGTPLVKALSHTQPRISVCGKTERFLTCPADPSLIHHL